MATQPAYRQFTADDYHRMADSGILREDDRVELIDGRVVEMSPIGGRHVTCVSRIIRLLVSRLTDDAVVNVQSPVRLGEYQEPEPDVAVVRNREYGNELPNADDVFLLMEVSDSSLAYDRGRKLALYSRAGIPEFWVIDIAGEAIERHTNPSGDRYGVTVRVGRGEAIESTRVPGLAINTDDVLGKQ